MAPHFGRKTSPDKRADAAFSLRENASWTSQCRRGLRRDHHAGAFVRLQSIWRARVGDGMIAVDN